MLASEETIPEKRDIDAVDDESGRGRQGGKCKRKRNYADTSGPSGDLCKKKEIKR